MTDESHEAVTIRPTSRHSAVASDIVLRDGTFVRLVFRPEVVNNTHNSAACVRGTFIYQKRGKDEEWADGGSTSLASLKKGEGYKLELKAAEVLTLLRELGALWRQFRRQGIPLQKVELVKLESRLVHLLELPKDQLNSLLEGNSTQALKTLARVLGWAAGSESLKASIAETPSVLPQLSMQLGLPVLQEAISFWKANRTQPAEEFWQRELSKRSFLLSLLLHYPIIVVQEKAFVGGKKLDNHHGGIADFLAKVTTTNAAVIVELKTPTAQLLGKEYRTDVFPPSGEFAGALSQVLHYRSSLHREVIALRTGSDELLEAEEPPCVIVIGDTAELDSTAKRRAFERLRSRLQGVHTVTFDEIFRRAEELLRLFSRTA